MLKATDDLRIKDIRELRTPAEVMHEFPRTDTATKTVLEILGQDLVGGEMSTVRLLLSKSCSPWPSASNK